MPAMNKSPEFYVGYQPRAPVGLARRLRAVVTLLLLLALAIAALLVIGQAPFDASRFEFQQYREYQGLYQAAPYPMLSVAGTEYLLVGEGKHGAAPLLPPEADNRTVSLKAALAANGSSRILELLPATVRLPAAAPPANRPAQTSHGVVTLHGEIVDTKCHAGVMNPGKGKVHRDCAVRCLSGGIPPGLLVRDASGAARVFVLVARDGRPLGRRILDYVAEPVVVTGEAMRQGSLWILAAGLDEIRRE